jgi:hypothetical protein
MHERRKVGMWGDAEPLSAIKLLQSRLESCHSLFENCEHLGKTSVLLKYRYWQLDREPTHFKNGIETGCAILPGEWLFDCSGFAFQE